MFCKRLSDILVYDNCCGLHCIASFRLKFTTELEVRSRVRIMVWYGVGPELKVINSVINPVTPTKARPDRQQTEPKVQ